MQYYCICRIYTIAELCILQGQDTLIVQSPQVHPKQVCSIGLDDCKILLPSRLWDTTYRNYDNNHDVITKRTLKASNTCNSIIMNNVNQRASLYSGKSIIWTPLSKQHIECSIRVFCDQVYAFEQLSLAYKCMHGCSIIRTFRFYEHPSPHFSSDIVRHSTVQLINVIGNANSTTKKRNLTAEAVRFVHAVSVLLFSRSNTENVPLFLFASTHCHITITYQHRGVQKQSWLIP